MGILWQTYYTKRSLPVWEEWIEIDIETTRIVEIESLPVWEEWIEIVSAGGTESIYKSLPVWEEWIEIKPL